MTVSTVDQLVDTTLPDYGANAHISASTSSQSTGTFWKLLNWRERTCDWVKLKFFLCYEDTIFHHSTLLLHMLSTEAVRAKSLSASNKWASAKEIAISACLWYRKRTNRVSMPIAADTDTVFQSTLWYRSPLLPSNYSTIMLVPSGQFPPHSLTVISAFVLYCLAINGPLSAFFFFWNSWERKKNTFVSHFTSPVPGLTSTTHTSRQIHTTTSFIYLKWGSQSHFCS